jgi:hypothetical protein
MKFRVSHRSVVKRKNFWGTMAWALAVVEQIFAGGWVTAIAAVSSAARRLGGSARFS